MDSHRPGAAKTGPFGGTVAHGFLTLSLAPLLLGEVVEVADASLVINYGLNKVRFPASAAGLEAGSGPT